ncbi:immunity protein 8 of polymorphic toxin system [Pantoea allii]|uniref:Immunity protein 8 of polymorphic toxin system n=1 Tax=Pantoea allii TaxID=574096 RepID=A0A2V2BBH4_9GAMM|nr:immunity 8 family protein [Pantoea allii]PWK93637.1 immunity protein 8 of polymorphic toxin system [Pantoea allii]
MKVTLKSIDCMHYDFKTYIPEDDQVAITLTLTIGSYDSEAGDNFDIFICTPEWLCKHQWLPELMRHTLLVRKYDLDEITKTITDYIDQCEGKDWMDIVQKLSRVFAWEYEDYQP